VTEHILAVNPDHTGVEVLVLRSVVVVSLVLLALVYLILRVRNARPTLPVRVATTLSLLLSILVSPIAVDELIQRTRPTNGIWWAAVEPGLIVWLPALLAATFSAAYMWRRSHAHVVGHQETRHAG
jgi:hypothetical protein